MENGVTYKRLIIVLLTSGQSGCRVLKEKNNNREMKRISQDSFSDQECAGGAAVDPQNPPTPLLLLHFFTAWKCLV